MIDLSTLTLGGVLKRIGSFTMDTFEGRLLLQKRIYLLQAFGLYIGYRFNWYVHGPYSPELTKAAFNLSPIYEQIPDACFESDKTERRFAEYLGFLGQEKDDPDWMEQLACTHFLKQIYHEADRDYIIGSVLGHETHFTREQCERAYDYLERNGLFR